MSIRIEADDLFAGQVIGLSKPLFTLEMHKDEQLIKSKAGVQQHGEVFTPTWMVKQMFSTPEIQAKIQDIHATFLEPSAGEGAFVKEIVHQRLSYVDSLAEEAMLCNPNWGLCRKESYWKEQALWSLMSIYAIEYLPGNLVKAQDNVFTVVKNHYQVLFQKKLASRTYFYKSAQLIVKLNMVQGNTLTHKNQRGDWIIFNEWRPQVKEDTGEMLVERIPFVYDNLFAEDGAHNTSLSKQQKQEEAIHKQVLLNCIEGEAGNPVFENQGQQSLFENEVARECLEHNGRKRPVSYKIVAVDHVWKEERLH